MEDADELAAALGLGPPPLTTPAPEQYLDGEVVGVDLRKFRKAKRFSESFPLTRGQIRERDRAFTQAALLTTDKKYLYALLSDRERKAIAVMIKTGSVNKAAEEVGVTATAIRVYLKRPFVKAYIEQLRARAAKASDLTLDKVAAVLSEAVDGSENVTDKQLAAASAAAKFLRPAHGGPASITVNQQNNFNGPSPFADMGQDEMLRAIKQNLLEMGDGEDGD